MKVGHRAALPAPASPVRGVFHPADHTVTEVVAYVTANPDQLERVYLAESEGRARSTLLHQLEALGD